MKRYTVDTHEKGLITVEAVNLAGARYKLMYMGYTEKKILKVEDIHKH